jgi:hypothetical protein
VRHACAGPAGEFSLASIQQQFEMLSKTRIQDDAPTSLEPFAAVVAAEPAGEGSVPEAAAAEAGEGTTTTLV